MPLSDMLGVTSDASQSLLGVTSDASQSPLRAPSTERKSRIFFLRMVLTWGIPLERPHNHDYV